MNRHPAPTQPQAKRDGGRKGGTVVKLALIGAGAWGRNLLRNLAHIRDAELEACCDSDGDSLAKTLNGFRGIRAVTDPEIIFDDPDIDAVAIATPAVTHFEFASRAIRSGKDVFVEKPMTLSLAEAEELVELAETNGRVLMVGHLLEYHPAVNKMKELLDSGEVGDPYYIYSERVNLGRIRSDENALWSFAPHDVSIILYILGQEPIEVAAHGAAYIQPGIEDVVFLCMVFPDNRLAQVHVSWLDPHKIRRTTLVGSKKMVVFDDMQASEKIRIYNKGVEHNGQFAAYADALSLRFGEVTVPAIKMLEPLGLECTHFVECVRDRSTPRSDGRDGIRVIRVLEAAQKSLRSGGTPVSLE